MQHFGHLFHCRINPGVCMVDLSPKFIQHSVRVKYYQKMFLFLLLNLHCLFVQLVGDVLRHVPDVSHTIGHQVHGLVLLSE